MIRVEPGQIWADKDPRSAGRQLTVESVDGRHAQCIARGRRTRILLNRFGRDYRLIEDRALPPLRAVAHGWCGVTPRPDDQTDWLILDEIAGKPETAWAGGADSRPAQVAPFSRPPAAAPHGAQPAAGSPTRGSRHGARVRRPGTAAGAGGRRSHRFEAPVSSPARCARRARRWATAVVLGSLWFAAGYIGGLALAVAWLLWGLR